VYYNTVSKEEQRKMAVSNITVILILNILTLIFTAIMAIAGVGAAFIIIPLIYYSGYDFLMATTIGLLLNTVSTGSASIRHAKNRYINYKIALPLIITSIITTPLGAVISDTIPRATLRIIFAIFLLLVGTNILINAITKESPKKTEKQKQKQQNSTQRIITSLFVGGLVGFIAGMLGIGGGSLILPFFLYYGIDTKEAAGTTSFIVVFSSFIGFISKISLTNVKIDWTLAITLVVTSIIAANIGSYLMHYKLKKHQIKLTMAIMLLLVSIKILIDTIF